MRKHHISLGENCLIDLLLEKYNLKEESYPFGWGRTNICYNLEIVKDDFKHLLSKKYLYITWLEEDKKNAVKNNYYKKSLNIFNETVNSDFEFTHHDVLNEKKDIDSFKRKIERFRDQLKSKDDIIFYYNYRNSPNNNIKELMKVFQEFSDYITKKYKKTNIKYVIFHQNINTKKKDFKIIQEGKFILIECFDNQEWRLARNYDGRSFKDKFDLIFKELNKIYGLKKNLVVTLANEKFIDQAKQLFSSVYFNSGWKGDYMLLAQDIPEKKLKWFKDKGIFIKKCDMIDNKLIGEYKCPPTRLVKFNIFSEDLKKWNKIIFLDADIIVRASLDNLTKIEYFGACSEGLKLKKHFVKKQNKIYHQLNKKYDLNSKSFNSGVMVFDSKMISKNTFSKLLEIFNKYKSVHKFADQPTLNLFFYEKVKFLSSVYNCLISQMKNHFNIKPNKIDAIILHFTGIKPWNKNSPFYKEWKNNLKKAELIDLNNIKNPKSIWSEDKIKRYDKYLKKRKIINYPKYILNESLLLLNKHIGLIGIFLKRKYPKIYNKLKNIKK